jgi:hypothetical protein
VDVHTVDWLAGPEGAALLATLPPYEEGRALAVGERLRRDGVDPAVVAAALTQSRLRARGVTKLGPEAATMLLTPDGLEQASRADVAALHAARFAAAGVRHVWDLGCGVGADARALADAGLSVTAVEADPVTAAVARANLAGRRGVRVVVGRAEEVVLPGGAGRAGQGAWLDPARRVTGVADARGRTRRVFRLSEVSPPWEVVQGVAARLPAVGAKFGPGFPHHEVPDGAQATWLSYGGEALECTLWWGDLVERPGRDVLVHDGTRWHILAPADSSGVPEAGGEVRPGDRLHDPDRAVLAAGLVGAVCAAVGGRESAPGSGYVVSRDGRATPWARCLEVVEVLPLQVKALRAWARSHDVGPLTLKKRGAWVDAEALRRQVRPRGSREATLVLTRLARPSGPAAVALWVRPCPDGSPGAR